MRTSVSSIAALTALALIAGSSTATAKRSHDIPAVKETGPAVDCINTYQISETRVRSDKVIDFRTSGRKWYRNTLPYSCPSLGFEERIMYKTWNNRLCSVDTITVLHDAGGLQRGASCGLGKFQPVEIAKR